VEIFRFARACQLPSDNWLLKHSRIRNLSEFTHRGHAKIPPAEYFNEARHADNVRRRRPLSSPADNQCRVITTEFAARLDARVEACGARGSARFISPLRSVTPRYRGNELIY